MLFDTPCDVVIAQRNFELTERHHTHAGARAGRNGDASRELSGDDGGRNARNLRAVALPCHEIPCPADAPSVNTFSLDPDVHAADVAAEAIENPRRTQEK